METLVAARLARELAPLSAPEVIDAAAVSRVREWVRAVSAEAALPTVAAESLATAASELAWNQLSHAQGGRVYVRRIERAGVAGVEVIALDHGPGIRSPAEAISGHTADRKGLGQGLGAVLRLSDEVDFEVRAGECTQVRARKFAGPVAFRSEVGMLGCPAEGEQVCGDDAAMLRMGEQLVLVLADGLGHGPEARRASGAAADLVHARGCQSPASLLADCDLALRDTRGAAVAVVCANAHSQLLEHACVGNIRTLVAANAGLRSLTCRPGIVGRGHLAPKSRPQQASTHAFGHGETLVMCSDGLKSRIDLPIASPWRTDHPIALADYLLEQYGRGTDDAMVIVCRQQACG